MQSCSKPLYYNIQGLNGYTEVKHEMCVCVWDKKWWACKNKHFLCDRQQIDEKYDEIRDASDEGQEGKRACRKKILHIFGVRLQLKESGQMHSVWIKVLDERTTGEGCGWAKIGQFRWLINKSSGYCLQHRYQNFIFYLQMVLLW